MKLIKQVLSGGIIITTYGVGLLQAKAYRMLKQRTAALLVPFGISTVDWALLGLLYDDNRRNGIRLSDVAKVLGVEAPFVTALVETLSVKGLVQTVKSAQDRRAKSLQLTAKGIALVPKIERQLRSEMKYLVSGASVKDLLAYQRVLKTIVDNGNKRDSAKK